MYCGERKKRPRLYIPHDRESPQNRNRTNGYSREKDLTSADEAVTYDIVELPLSSWRTTRVHTGPCGPGESRSR